MFLFSMFLFSMFLFGRPKNKPPVTEVVLPRSPQVYSSGYRRFMKARMKVPRLIPSVTERFIPPVTGGLFLWLPEVYSCGHGGKKPSVAGFLSRFSAHCSHLKLQHLTPNFDF